MAIVLNIPVKKSTVTYFVYSGGSNTERPKTESIRKPNLFLFCFRMVDHSKTEHSKTELQNGRFSLDHFINIIFIYLFIKQLG